MNSHTENSGMCSDPLFYALLLVVCFAGSLPGGHLQAEPLQLPPPSAPWVGSVPEKGTWEVIVSESPSKPPTAPEGTLPAQSAVNKTPARITSTTWNAVKQDSISYSDGSSATVFYFAGMALIEGMTSQGKPAPVLVQQLPGTDYATLRSQGWLALDWLDGKFFIRTEAYKRTVSPAKAEPEICHYYRKPEGMNPQTGSFIPELHAWISISDLQPVAARIGSKVLEFQRLPDPIQPPPMTAEQAAKLMDLKEQNARMEKLRERNKRLRGE